MTLLTVIAVLAFLGAGAWQYRRLSPPLIGYTAAIRHLTQRLTDDEETLESIADSPGILADTAVAAAVAEIVATDGSRSVSAIGLINEGLIAADIPELRRLETVPGQFIGAGLMATFSLLALAVYQAAAALSAESQTLEGPMQALLQTAATKFIVSIAAIAVSLILVHRRTELLIAADHALAGLATALDRLLPPVAASGEAAALARQQAATLARIEDQLASLADPKATLAAALTSAMVPVAASISAMGDQVANTNADALERMVHSFTRELGERTRQYNDQLAETLKETVAALDATPARIRAAARATEELLDAAADRTGMALGTSGAVFAATAERLQAIADQARLAEQRLDGALDTATSNADAAATRLAQLTGGMETAAAAVAAASGSAAAATEALAGATQSAAHMTSETNAWSSGMRDVDGSLSKIIERIRSLLPAAERAPPPDDHPPVERDGQ